MSGILGYGFYIWIFSSFILILIAMFGDYDERQAVSSPVPAPTPVAAQPVAPAEPQPVETAAAPEESQETPQ